MLLPHPGIGARPRVDVPRDVDLPVVEPTLESDCRNLWESVGWHRGITKDPKMSQSDNSIVLSLNIDGFQPFTRGGITLHPLLLQILNLPENMRHQDSFMVLAGVIPGRKAPKNLNTYMEPMVDELLHLYENGMLYHDPYLNTPRRAYVKLLFTACDFPGHAMVNCMHKQGSIYGCHKCDLQGVVVKKDVGGTSRVLYQGFAGLAASPPVLPAKLTDAIYRRRGGAYAHLGEKHRARKADPTVPAKEKTMTALKKARMANCLQVHGRSQLARLPGFDMVEGALLDMMHTLQGIISGHIMPLLKGERLGKYAAPKQKAISKAQQKRNEKQAKEDSVRSMNAALAAGALHRPAAAAAASSSGRRSRLVDDERKSNDGSESDEDGATEGSESDDEKDDMELNADEAAALEADENDPSSADHRPSNAHDPDGDIVMRDAPAASSRPRGANNASSAAADRLQHERVRLAQFASKFTISPQDQKRLEARSYDLIQAPGKVAPATKKPFSTSGYMTADNWLVFTRVYAKYIFKQHFCHPDQQPQLIALCHLVDLLSLCTRYQHTTATKREIARLAKVVALHFQNDFPPTEHAIVVHNLLFHIPETINMWGPAVGYWCFPFERSVHSARAEHRRTRTPHA